MKKKHLCLVLTLIFALLLGGCASGETADKYVGDLITSIKKEDPSSLSSFLEQGISDENETYVLQFPDELKDSYLKFLQASFNAVEFEINGAKKIDDERYSVQLTFTPLDIEATTKNTCEKYSPAISSTDLNTEMTKLLEKATEAVKSSPSYEASTQLTLEVKKSKDGYSLDDEQLQKLFSATMDNIMAPYDSVCEILDAQDYLTSCLNALFKNDVAEYAKHTGEDESSVQSQLESSMYAPPEELGASYTERYSAALKAICNNCQYSVGTPKKQDGLFNYIIDVTVTPNTSFQSAMNELETGTYYSEEEVDRALVELMEKYAAAPTYGAQTTVTVSLNFKTLAAAGAEDSEITSLIDTILPVE